MKQSTVLRIFTFGLINLSTVCHVFATDETVYVKYCGPVNLSKFDCETVTRSSVIKRLCYDKEEQYVIVNLANTYYHYCGMPSNTVIAWKNAESMGKFYHKNVKGRYDCRVIR